MIDLHTIGDLEEIMGRAKGTSQSVLGEATGTFAFETEQITAINAPLGPEVIIAGAGTGKTTVMAARVAWLVGTHQVEASHVLGLTFTRKAAAKLARDIGVVLAQLGLDPTDVPDVSTYDSFAAGLVADWGTLIGYDSTTRLLEGASAHMLATEVIRQATGSYPHLADKALTTITKAVVSMDAQMQSHLTSVDAVENYTRGLLDDLRVAPRNRLGNPFADVISAMDVCEERLELLDLCRAYQEAKRRQSVVDYADQMAQAVTIVDRVPLVGSEVRRKYHVVLLDEYQDTSAAQAHLLSGLFGARANITGYPVTGVGDPLQAIYTWRGAAVDNIFSFHSTFPSTSPVTTMLAVNRRSSQAILDVANTLTRTIKDPLIPKDLVVTLRAPHQAASSQSDDPVKARQFVTWDEETAWIAQSIAEAHESGVPWPSMAILVRRNSLIAPIYEACAARGVPVEVQGLAGLLGTSAVSHIVAMLRVLNDSSSNQDLIDILLGPRFAFSADELEAVSRRARHLADERVGVDDQPSSDQDGLGVGKPDVRLLDAVADPERGMHPVRVRRALSILKGDLDSLRRMRGHLIDLVTGVIERTGLNVEAQIRHDRTSDHVTQFLSHVSAFCSASQDPSVDAFLSYLDAEAEYGVGLVQATRAEDAVLLSTVHQAKGLEWDRVYLPGLVDSVFPEARVRDNPVRTASALPTAVRSDARSFAQLDDITGKGLEDYAQWLRDALRRAEDRLAYVALTRARHAVIVTSHVWETTRTTPCSLSPYFLMAADNGHSTLVDEEMTPVEKVPAMSQWPIDDEHGSARTAAAAVRQAGNGMAHWEGTVPEESRRRIGEWDEAIRLLSERSSDEQIIDVEAPSPMSTSMALRVARDPCAVASSLALPLPRPASPTADLGSAFHAWVEHYYALSQLVDVDEMYAWDAKDLEKLVEGFLASPFSSAHPVAVEKDFRVSISGQVLSGRIDAIFEKRDNESLVPDGASALIVDWKTGRSDPNPDQLAVYAYAWSHHSGVPMDRLRAGFFHVPTRKWKPVDIRSAADVEDLVAHLVIDRR